jgi:hypothetical protein
MADRLTVIEKGAQATGRILRVKRAHALAKPGQLWIGLEGVGAVDGTRVPLRLLETMEGPPARRTPWPRFELSPDAVYTAPFWVSALLVHQFGKQGGQFEAPDGTQFQAAVAPPLTPDGKEIGVPVNARLIPKNALDVDLRNALVGGSADRVRTCLRQGADIHAWSDAAVLPETAAGGNAALVEVLLESNVEPGERPNALASAAEAGHLSLVLMLLGHMQGLPCR